MGGSERDSEERSWDPLLYSGYLLYSGAIGRPPKELLMSLALQNSSTE